MKYWIDDFFFVFFNKQTPFKTYFNDSILFTTPPNNAFLSGPAEYYFDIAYVTSATQILSLFSSWAMYLLLLNFVLVGLKIKSIAAPLMQQQNMMMSKAQAQAAQNGNKKARKRR